MTKKHTENDLHSPRLPIVLFGASILIYGGLLILNASLKDISGNAWLQPNIQLHIAFELSGTFIAFIVAFLLLRLDAINRGSSVISIQGSSFNRIIASAQIGMGLLDGFHAIQPVGNLLVWLHSVATLTGGLLFVLVWIPAPTIKPVLKALPGLTFLAAGVIGVWSLVTEQLPNMMVAGEFSPAAVLLNVIGGGLMLLASVRLFLSYRQSRRPADLLFFGQCLFLGLAGILFEQSSLWDVSWWGWHLLRLIGYLMALWLVWSVINSIQESVQRSNKELERLVVERTNLLIEVRRENEDRLFAVTETARHAIITADAGGLIVSWNSAATRMFGFAAEEIVGQSLTRIIPQRFRQRAMDGFYRMLNGDPEHLDGSSAELIGLRKDDSEVLLERSVALWQTKAGQFYTCTMSDIGERKKAQDALSASEAFKLTILNSVAAEIAVIDNEGTILEVNEPWRSFSLENSIEPGKVAPNTDVGANYFAACHVGDDLTSPEALAAINGIQAVLDGSLRVFSMEYPCNSPDQLRWFTMNVIPLESGIRNGAVITHTNITRIKQAEEHARQLLAENQTILSNALVGIVHLKQRRIVSCNRRFEAIFQYEPGELIDASTELLYATHEIFLDLEERPYRALGEGKAHSEEALMRHKDGSLFWGAMNGCAIDPAHPYEGSIWIYADISERLAAEQETNKLLRAVEQSPVSIVITNKAGAIEYVNPSFTRITGYARHEVIGQNPRILQSGNTSKETYRKLWDTILNGGTWRGVMHNRCMNGELIWEDTSISPILDAAGEITHFVAVKEDVTQAILIEQQLKQHQIHLEDLVAQRTAELSEALEVAKLADKAKDEFLANVTHELRTPLSAVIGFSSLARPLATDTRQREYLDKVNSAGKTLAGTIDDLLDLSKIAAGRLEFESGPFSLRQVVAAACSLTSFKAQEKGLQLVERIAEEVPDVLIGDRLRVEQILLNLLSNAVKFTTVGRVELRIGLHALEEERICLKIEVEDTGIGLTEAGIAQLFKPFSQADASMTRKFGGTGLGLAICKHLAELMGGEISVISREGVGSTFHVRLWLRLCQTGELPAAEDSGQEAAQVKVRYQDARVLVVDDQPFNRDVVEGLLAAVGITPQLTENGQQAVDMLTSGTQAFDLVLMDIQMPVMDGLTASRAIRSMARFAELPVIAMTAHTMAHERDKSAAAGMNDHIGKPFDEAGFYRVLAKWIPASKQRVLAAAAPLPEPTNDLPPLQGVDTRAGLSLLQGDEARYRHWLKDFVSQAPAAMAEIRRALAAGEPEPASMAAHTLKGRCGLLGMKQLHPIAAALEAAIEAGQPTSELLLDLEHGVAAMCAEIQCGLALEIDAEPAAEAAPDQLPSGVPPMSITRLIERLQAGDSDNDVLVAACLAELKDTAWAPHLRQALRHARNFDYAAAGRLLCAERQEPAKES